MGQLRVVAGGDGRRPPSTPAARRELVDAELVELRRSRDAELTALGCAAEDARLKYEVGRAARGESVEPPPGWETIAAAMTAVLHADADVERVEHLPLEHRDRRVHERLRRKAGAARQHLQSNLEGAEYWGVEHWVEPMAAAVVYWARTAPRAFKTQRHWLPVLRDGVVSSEHRDALRAWLRQDAERIAKEHRQRQKGGEAEKKLPNVWMATCLLVGAEPGIRAPLAWERFPNGGDLSAISRMDWLVYRDGERLVDDAVGEGRSIEYKAFCRYLSDARRLLRSK